MFIKVIFIIFNKIEGVVKLLSILGVKLNIINEYINLLDYNITKMLNIYNICFYIS